MLAMASGSHAAVELVLMLAEEVVAGAQTEAEVAEVAGEQLAKQMDHTRRMPKLCCLLGNHKLGVQKTR